MNKVERHREQVRRYYLKNKGKISEYQKKYYQENKEKLKEYQRNYHLRCKAEEKEWLEIIKEGVQALNIK